MTLRRRKFIRIISYLVALCVVFAVSGIFSQKAKADYESALERVRLDGLASLTEYSREISSGLRLLAVSAGDSLIDSSSYVSARAVGALGSLGCFYSEKVDNMNRFFSGVYDFSESFSGNEESRKAAVKLSDYAQEMYYHLSDLTNAVVNGEYTLTEYDSVYSKAEMPYFENELDFYNGTEDEIFSIITPASAEKREFIFFEGKESISADEAKNTASAITGISHALWRGGEITGDDGIEVYALICGDTAVDICKTGGAVKRIIDPLPCKESVYNVEDARKKAVAFLADNGFENMVTISAAKEEFTAGFVFAPQINGVLLLTAKIEVDICLASGKVTYYDATDYIMRYRTDIAAVNGIPEVENLIPQLLTLKKVFLCVDDINGAERLCCLAVCSFDGDTVYVYIDYYTLKIIKTRMTS